MNIVYESLIIINGSHLHIFIMEVSHIVPWNTNMISYSLSTFHTGQNLLGNGHSLNAVTVTPVFRFG